jgi:L-seryl-tRNA(Ser) seleniumtransferase
MSINPLRNIPSVNELLESPPLRKLRDRISLGAVVSTVRTVLDEVRHEVQSAAAERTLPSVTELGERIARRVLETEESSVRPVINATGVLLHPDLGEAPLAEAALEEIKTIARDYASLELDLATGGRSSPARGVSQMLSEISGAEAALVVNNHAGAILLALAAVAAGREVIVSRGQLIELGDGCRLADLVGAGGAVLREVGATNRTLVGDYLEAIGPQTAALMSVHPSDFLIVGATESVPLRDLVEVARKHQLPVVHSLSSRGLIDADGLGLGAVPVVSGSVKAGADLVLFSGERLLGGPQSGILVGRRALVERIERHPLAGALRVGKLTLSALAATLRLHQDPEKARREIPLLLLLGTSVENLRNRAQRLAPQLAATRAVKNAEPEEAVTTLAGQSIPGEEVPTWCIAVTPEGTSVERLAASLRSGTPSVVGRIEGGRLLLDLRGVIPRQDVELVEAFTGLGSG